MGTEEFEDIKQIKDVRDKARAWRRKFIRYREAEYIYGIQHKKVLELADKAGALYRMIERIKDKKVVVQEKLVVQTLRKPTFGICCAIIT